MKNRLFLLGIVFVAACAFVLPPRESRPGAGIDFSHMSLEAAMKDAEKSGKLIFIDVHTSWCGPCKQMAKTTFQSPDVAKVFNKNFINLKIDAEKDADGPAVSEKYSVMAYPTLLFIDGKGKVVKRLVGMQSEEQLLGVAKKLLK